MTRLEINRKLRNVRGHIECALDDLDEDDVNWIAHAEIAMLHLKETIAAAKKS